MSQASDDDSQLGDREKVVQQISQMWYNNINGDDVDFEDMDHTELLIDMGEMCGAQGIDDPEERLEIIIDGFREAMEMQVEQTVEEMEKGLRAHFRMFGL